MKKFLLMAILLVMISTSIFSISWKWIQEGNEFLLLGISGKSVELGFRIRDSWLPVKFYTNNNYFLFFVDANEILRIYQLRPSSGSCVLKSRLDYTFNPEWGRPLRINPYADETVDEIAIRFEDEKTRVFSYNIQENIIKMVREHY